MNFWEKEGREGKGIQDRHGGMVVGNVFKNFSVALFQSLLCLPSLALPFISDGGVHSRQGRCREGGHAGVEEEEREGEGGWVRVGGGEQFPPKKYHSGREGEGR